MNNELGIARETILNTKNANNSVKFEKLWKTVCSKCKTLKEDNEDQSSDFYISLLEDPHFIKLNNNEWTLKELFAYDDVKKISTPIYATEEFEINEDEYANYLSDIELKELKNKSKGSVTSALDIGDESLIGNYDESELDDVKVTGSIAGLEGDEYND
ncbi:MAG: DNA-directed RNA polymerase subunit delta [Mycoplasma sp.]